MNRKSKHSGANETSGSTAIKHKGIKRFIRELVVAVVVVVVVVVAEQ